MTDSAPALRRMLNEARERIRELEAREIEVHEIERVVYVDKPRDVLQTVYVDRVVEVPGPATEVEKPVPFEVLVPQYPPSVERVEIFREVYVDNPDHIETIRALQEKLCQFTSQSDSSQNPDQSGPSSESADLSTETAE